MDLAARIGPLAQAAPNIGPIVSTSYLKDPTTPISNPQPASYLGTNHP